MVKELKDYRFKFFTNNRWTVIKPSYRIIRAPCKRDVYEILKALTCEKGSFLFRKNTIDMMDIKDNTKGCFQTKPSSVARTEKERKLGLELFQYVNLIDSNKIQRIIIKLLDEAEGYNYDLSKGNTHLNVANSFLLENSGHISHLLVDGAYESLLQNEAISILTNNGNTPEGECLYTLSVDMPDTASEKEKELACNIENLFHRFGSKDIDDQCWCWLTLGLYIRDLYRIHKEGYLKSESTKEFITDLTKGMVDRNYRYGDVFKYIKNQVSQNILTA